MSTRGKLRIRSVRVRVTHSLVGYPADSLAYSGVSTRQNEYMSFGRLLIIAGVILIGLGALVLFMSRLNLPLGRMPGDIVWRGKNTTVYFPIVTCVILSLLGTLLLWLINRR